MTNLATKLVEANLGKRWTKSPTLDRVYITDGTKLRYAGLEVERYKSGNVSSARLNGKPISNNQARGLLWALTGSKLWYDVTTGKWTQQLVGGTHRDDEKLTTEVFARIVADANKLQGGEEA